MSRFMFVLFSWVLAGIVPFSAALACSDLPNICAMHQAHHQEMMDIAATPPQRGEEEYYEEEPYYTERQWDDWARPSGALTDIAKNYKLMSSDSGYADYTNGTWIYPGSELKTPPKGLPCSALYMRKGVGALLLGPPPGEQMASMIFFGPDIPRPAGNTKVLVTLEQSDGPPQTTNVMHMPFESDFGALLFAVPTMPLLVDNLLDKETFNIVMNGKSVATLEWTGGLATKGKLANCIKQQ